MSIKYSVKRANGWATDILHPDSPEAVPGLLKVDIDTIPDIISGAHPIEAYKVVNSKLVFDQTRHDEIMAERQVGIDAKAERDVEIAAMTADEELQTLAAMNAGEIDVYVDSEMTGVPMKSQVHFKKLTKMIAVLARGTFN